MFLIVELLFIILLTMVLFILYRNEKILKKRQTPKGEIEDYWTGKERRQAVRFKENLDVTYIVEKKAHLKNSGKALDISESGIKLLLGEKLSKGTILDLRISDPSSKKALEIEGEVIWSGEFQETREPSEKRLFHVGLKFLGIRSPSGILVSEFIRSLCVGET